MAFLDKKLLEDKIISEEEYYNILARLELKEWQDREIEMKQVQALEKVNTKLAEHDQPPLTLSWVKKWWNRL